LSWACNGYGNANYQMTPFENVDQIFEIIEKYISSLLLGFWLSRHLYQWFYSLNVLGQLTAVLPAKIFNLSLFDGILV